MFRLLHKNAKRRSALFIILTLLGSLSLGTQQTSTGNGAKVSLLFTVTDKKSKQFVTTLRKEDVRVLEDGVQQEIIAFTQQTGNPLSIVLMLDTSVSQERVLPNAKKVSREFVDSILRPSKDSVGVVSFTYEAKFEQELTGELQQVRQAIDRLQVIPPKGYISGGAVVGQPPTSGKNRQLTGSTAIWDALSSVSEKLGIQASDNPRRVIILITDGQDTSSRSKLKEAAEAAVKSGVVVYSIGIGDEYYGGIFQDDLRKISEQTGGRAFFPQKVRDLRPVFAEIEQELRSQYLISYSTANKKADDKMRKIKIEIINPELRKQGLQLSYQPGYYAKKG
jgi:Ca-activated chloride channel family protein